MFATGVTMGLAEWFIDDTCLVFLTFAEKCHEYRYVPSNPTLVLY